MTSRKDIVYGECTHGRSMITCSECNPVKVEPIKDLEEMRKAVENLQCDVRGFGEGTGKRMCGRKDCNNVWKVWHDTPLCKSIKP